MREKEKRDMPYSVLMPIYDGEKPEYLEAAVESMLRQTVPPGEFVVVCDGPLTEELDNVLAAFTETYPELFRVLRLKKNLGLGSALNAGLKLCRNELVARMDSDDIALPKRCERQLAAFRADAQLDLCSGDIAEFWDDPNIILSVRRVPRTHEAIVQFARRRNPMNHMAVMYRKAAVEKAGGYMDFRYAEDYYLWVRMLQKGCKTGNIGEILVKARIGNGMYRRRGGLQYMAGICCLEKKFLDVGFITRKEFFVNCAVRVGVGLVPSGIRGSVYQKVLRNYGE